MGCENTEGIGCEGCHQRFPEVNVVRPTPDAFLAWWMCGDCTAAMRSPDNGAAGAGEYPQAEVIGQVFATVVHVRGAR